MDLNPPPVTTKDFGKTGDAVATDDTGSWSLLQLVKRLLQRGFSNPAVVGPVNLTATTAAPATVAGLTAGSFVAIEGGTASTAHANVSAINGTVSWYGTVDGVNLIPMSALSSGGAVGTGSLAQSVTTAGTYQFNSAGVRTVYAVLTAGASATVALGATVGHSRLTAILRGSFGGSVSAPAGVVPTESVAVAYPSVTHADRSGTITTGGAAQQLMAANTARRGYWIQNVSAGDLWINGQGSAAASQPSLKIVAGAYYEAPLGGCPTTAISVFGATTGQAFSSREW